MLPLRGRTAELGLLLQAWDQTRTGAMRYVCISGEPGVGKTRLVQELYCRLARHFDPPSPEHPGGYWPDLPAQLDTVQWLAPPLPTSTSKLPPMPYFWWALSCRQGNESQRESFQPFADGMEQLRAHLLPQVHSTLVKEAWSEVAHGAVFGSLEYIPLIGPVLKGMYQPLRQLNRRLHKFNEPLPFDEQVLLRGTGPAGGLEEAYIQVIAALNHATGKHVTRLPVCIILDDAQWADARSISFVQRLLELSYEHQWRLMLVTTVRTTETGGKQLSAAAPQLSITDLEQELVRRAGADCIIHMDLASNLAEPAIRELLHDQLPQAAPAVITKLLERTGGQPFFAVNYARLALEEGWLDKDGNLAVNDSVLEELPAEVSAIIDRRLGLLDADRLRVLRWGSVQGLRFIDRLIECAAAKFAQSAGDALTALDSLQLASKLVEEMNLPAAIGRFYQFSHRLVFERVCQDYGPQLQEYQVVRAALGEMLRQELEQQLLQQWPGDEQHAALQYLFDYSGERCQAPREVDRAGWLATQLGTAAQLLEQLHGRGDFQQAERLAVQALAAYKTGAAISGNPQLVPLLRVLCHVFDLRGRWDEWRYCTQEWLTRCLQGGDEAGGLEALLNQAELHIALSAYPEALESLEHALNSARRLGNRVIEADALEGMAEIKCLTSKYAEAIELFQLALAIRTDLREELGVLLVKTGIADVHRQLMELDKAEKLYDELLAGFTKIDYQRGRARALRCLGEIWSFRQDDRRAMEYFEQCLAIYQQLGDEFWASETTRVLAVSLSHLGQLDKAKELASASLALSRRLGNRHSEARNLHTLATICLMAQDLAQALPLLQKSIDLFEVVGDSHAAIKTLFNIAWMHSHAGDEPQALALFQQTAQKLHQIGDTFFEGGALACVGWLMLCLRRLDEGIEYSERAYVLAPEDNAYFNISLGKWLRGDTDALEHYRAGIKIFGHAPDPADFEEVVRRGLADADAISALKQQLGLTPEMAGGKA